MIGAFVYRGFMTGEASGGLKYGMEDSSVVLLALSLLV